MKQSENLSIAYKDSCERRKERKLFYRRIIKRYENDQVFLCDKIRSLPYWRFIYAISLNIKYNQIEARIRHLTKEMRSL